MDSASKKKGFMVNAKQAVIVTLVLLFICGLLFPLLLNGLSALLFPKQANGNLITADGKVVGSEFVGQDFTEDYFMKCRPSAYNYNTYYEDKDGNLYYNDGSEFKGLGSGSNNYAPTNPELIDRVEADIEEFLKANPDIKKEDIPTDLLTASGSGLDPHISTESAEIQIPAISKASGISEEKLEGIVSNNTDDKLFGVLGENVVNVLGVNLEIAKEMGLISEFEK